MSSSAAPAGFDPAFYLRAYPGLAEANVNPLEHYLMYGQKEGRFINQQQFDDAKNGITAQQREAKVFQQNDPYGFDAAFYLKTNPGLAEAKVDPLQHYLNYGMQEGRARNAFQAEGGYGQAINPAAGQYIPAPTPSAALDPNDPASWAAFRKQAHAETEGINRMPRTAPNTATLSADPLGVQRQFYPEANNYGFVPPGSNAAAAPSAPSGLEALLAQMGGGSAVANLGMGYRR